MRLLRAIRLRIAPTTGHEHYCDTCDRNWPHDGEAARSCTSYWAWRCQECRDTPAPVPAPAPAASAPAAPARVAPPVAPGFELRFVIEEHPRPG